MESLYTLDEDAEYVADVRHRPLSQLKPTVSFPHLPENTKTIDEVGDVPIQQVVIGSCTNGQSGRHGTGCQDPQRQKST